MPQEHLECKTDAPQTITTKTTNTDTIVTTITEPTAVTAAIVPPEPVAKPIASSICLLKTAVVQVNEGGVHVEATYFSMKELKCHL